MDVRKGLWPGERVWYKLCDVLESKSQKKLTCIDIYMTNRTNLYTDSGLWCNNTGFPGDSHLK